MHTEFRQLAYGALALAALTAACSSDEGGSVTPPPPPPALEPPSGVAAQATTANTARVTWNAATNATSYLIQRAQGAGGQFESVGSATASPFDDSGLNPQTTYRYKVASLAGTQQSSFSGEAQVTTPAPIQPTVEVTADITTNTTWTKNNLYVLKGFIHVANGATLTIQAGTKIVGDFNTLGSSLFVLRGAKIQAIGTTEEPIVFTSSRAEGQRQAGDWGGLIIVGNGVINRTPPVILEGSNTGGSNYLIDYAGGNNNADDSGRLSYVRVEFAGYAPAENAELNSFTFAAVGSGTILDHLQSLNGLDDSFEFFGGAVDGKYLVSYNSGDDHFDMSEGYVGRLQYLIAYQTRTVIPRPLAGNISSDPQGIENDGCAGSNCTNGSNSLPLNVPLVANATLIGPPSTVTNSSGNIGLMLRRGTGGQYINVVTVRWARAGISLRDQPTLDRIGEGNMFVRNVLVADAPVVFQAQSGATVQGAVDMNANAIEAQLATGLAGLFVNVPNTEPANGAILDFTPATGSAAAAGGLDTFTGSIAAKAAGFVAATTYRGATGVGFPKWWEGWTYFAVN